MIETDVEIQGAKSARRAANHSAIPSVLRGHQELLSRKYLQILAMLFCRGYWNDMFVCATFPKFIIDTNECFSLLQARKLPSNSGPPPLGSNMLMVDVFKLQNLFFPRHSGSHHHTWDFYSSNPTYFHKLVAATAAVVTVNIKFMTWTFCRLPLRHGKGKSTPLSLLDLSLTFARLRAASLPRLAAARRLISIAPTDTELSPPELQYLPLSELRYIHG